MARELFDILTFDHSTVENVPITTTDPDWTELIDLVTPTRAIGLYGLAFSLQFSLNSTTQSFIYQFSLDNGATWGPEYQKEVKDRSNIEVIEIFSLLELTAPEVIALKCRVTREGSADCEVIKGMITCERKA
jgi:hypothetical protein